MTSSILRNLPQTEDGHLWPANPFFLTCHDGEKLFDVLISGLRSWRQKRRGQVKSVVDPGQFEIDRGHPGSPQCGV